jgi:hypothetical protein
MKRFRNILVGVDLTNVDPQMPGALGTGQAGGQLHGRFGWRHTREEN